MLDHLLGGDGLPRRARKLIVHGKPAPAMIVGIRVSSRGKEPETDRWEYALRVEANTGSRVLGVRQQLVPHRERAHLGAMVVVRADQGERAVIDWTRSMAGWGVEGVARSAADWAMVEPPQEGSIDDRRRSDAHQRIGRGEHVELELVEADRSAALGGILAAWDLRLRVGAVDHDLSAVNVPAYAVHLLVPDRRLLGVLDERGIELDWERSAAETSVRGESTGFDFDTLLAPIPQPDGTIEDLDGWMAEFDQWKRR